MDYIPKYYRTNKLSLICMLEAVSDSRGNLRYAVTFPTGSKENNHFLFEHLSSALDFIKTNFGHE